MSSTEQTLSIIKPDAVERNLSEKIKEEFKKDGFKTYMNSIGKLGGQNKIPKISNDRKIADQLKNLNLIQ